MKILQVITSLEMGGAETLVVNLILRLQALGYTVDLCVFNGINTPLMQKLKRESPHITIYTLGSGVYNPFYILKLIKVMRGYDIVHTHNSSPQLFVAITNLFTHKKLVSTEHTTSNRKRDWKWYAPVESWMYQQYQHIICISTIAEMKLRKYMGGDWLNKTNSDRNAILMVAGFRTAKDQGTIVKALNILDKEKFEVWFAGIGDRMDDVKQLVESLGITDNVRFLGLRTDIPNVLKAADFIVMSSHWEGLSLSNVEGMSAHKPFIASNVNGLREVTEGYGILFPHEDAGTLAKEINHLAEDENYYKEIAGRCFDRALQFDINKTVDGYEKVYQTLMSNDKR